MDPFNQMVVTKMLQIEGHKVHVVNNGQEALIASEEKRFDLIMMDIQMPVMDGFDATRHIRHMDTKYNRQTKIIALTAHAMMGDKKRCLNAGVDDYLSKPVSREQLQNMLTKHFANDHKERAKEPAVAH